MQNYCQITRLDQLALWGRAVPTDETKVNVLGVRGTFAKGSLTPKGTSNATCRHLPPPAATCRQLPYLRDAVEFERSVMLLRV